MGCFMQQLSFCIGPIENCSSQVGPIIKFHFRHNDEIDWNAERTEQPAQAHHFFTFTVDGRLDNQKINVGIIPRITPSIRSEQDDFSRIRSCYKRANKFVDRFCRNHQRSIYSGRPIFGNRSVIPKTRV